jgi:2-succinyl-5-enolpyruvyl-6-hydroxy-3-cyclohexene-1-carboxylate synthase
VSAAARRAAHLVGAWCRVLVGALADAGVRDVVISPGSRSTPLVLALSGQAGLRLMDVVDERSAGFVALGLARVTGRPAALVCTSGTAGAHYLPAVIEASMAHVPMLVVTADRPQELQACGAPQTIDQVRLFGVHARAFLDAGDPAPSALRAAARMASQAVHATLWPVPGPVQLNVRARKPLEPGPPVDGDEASAALAALEAAVRARPPTRALPPALVPAPEAIGALADALRGGARGLLVAGPMLPGVAPPPRAALALSARAGYPLLAEATSNLRFAGTPPGGVAVVDAFPALLADPGFRAAHAPDVIVELGAPATAGAYAAFLEAHPGARRFVLAPHGWNDPHGTAEALILGDVAAALEAVTAALGPGGPADPDWARRWARAGAAARRAVEAAVDGEEPALSEAVVVARALAAAPRGAWLVLGNSLPVRHADLHGAPGVAELRVLSQRGASGIDGLLSGAAGAALAAGAPVLALVGDLAALHDLGGLAACRAVRTPLVLLVLNNDGGRIFEQLPVAGLGLDPGVIARFTTPHGLSLEGAAATFGLPHRAVRDEAALGRALAEALERPGATLVEAHVPPHGAAALSRRLAALVRAELDRDG